MHELSWLWSLARAWSCLLLQLVSLSLVADAQTTATGYRFVQTLQPEMLGLGGPFDIVASPDGLDVYVSGFLEDSIVQFKRDPSTGALSWWQTRTDGQGAVIGLDGPEQLVVSPDGGWVYVAAHNTDSVLTFLRNVDGELQWMSTYSDPVVLDGAATITITPAGDRVYAAGFSTDSIQVFSRAPSGQLQPLYSVSDPDLDGVLALVATPAQAGGHHLYAAASRADVLSTWHDTGTQLVQLQAFSNANFAGIGGFDGVNDLALSNDAQHLYSGSSQDSSVVHFTRAPNGLLTFVEEHDYADFSHVARVTLSPGEDLLYLTSAANDQVFSMNRDQATGELSFALLPRGGGSMFPGLDNPYGITTIDSHVYVTSLLHDTVLVYDEFEPRPVVPFAFPIGAHGQRARAIGSGALVDLREFLARAHEVEPGGHLSSGGFDRFYVSQEYPHGGVASALVHRASGQVQIEWVYDTGSSEPSVATSPDGRFVYIARDEQNGTSELDVFRVDFPGSEPLLRQNFVLEDAANTYDARTVLHHPSLDRLYVFTTVGTLLVYQVQPDGTLAYLSSRTSSLWSGAIDAVISPLGDALFAAVESTDGVVRWGIDANGDPSTGAAYVSNFSDPVAIAISNDGRYLSYATAPNFNIYGSRIVGSSLGPPLVIAAGGTVAGLSEGPGGRIYAAIQNTQQIRVWERRGSGGFGSPGSLGADVCSPQNLDPCLLNASAVAVGVDGKTIFSTGAGGSGGPPTGSWVVHRDDDVVFLDGFESGGWQHWSTTSQGAP